jgi:hypothetical protein
MVVVRGSQTALGVNDINMNHTSLPRYNFHTISWQTTVDHDIVYRYRAELEKTPLRRRQVNS